MRKETDDLDIQLIGGTPVAPQSQQAEQSEKQKLIWAEEDEDRYSRFRLIPWWDQDILKQARVLVVGAGALGNEIMKNLALLGVGKIFLIDLDRIENSNLSRSVLYRQSDEGSTKAEVAARSAMEINPDITVRPFVGNIVHDVGLGVFRSMDVVICGLDNREARLWVNQCCWRVNRPWIDGAIEVLHGLARVFVPPDGACYECTMNQIDYEMLRRRKSCALLTREQMLEGKVPTTPTVSAVIAGIQCQEAVKLIHNRPDLPVLAGKGYFFDGLAHDSYVVNYVRKQDCMSHETFGDIVQTDWRAQDLTLGEALERAKADLGEEAVLDLHREIVHEMTCEQCSVSVQTSKLLGKMTESDAACPKCGEVMALEMCHSISGDEAFLDKTLAEIGMPAFDIISGRCGMTEMFYELSGDRAEALGDIAD
jgi:molybdopterin/thiamine biosynthesis adenylyltransferase